MTLKISATGLRLRILLAAEKSVAHDLRLYYGIKNKYGAAGLSPWPRANA
jgi:hypothetical protein